MRTVWWSDCEKVSAVTTVFFSTLQTRLDVVGIQVGQRLEQRQRHHQLADAADVLLVVAAVLGIDRLGRVGQVEHRQPGGLRIAAEHGNDPLRERGIGRRQVEGLADQPGLHLRRVQQRTGRLLDVAHLTLLRQSHALQPADAGRFVAVERIGQRRRRRPAGRAPPPRPIAMPPCL